MISPVVGGRPEGRVTPQCCAEYFLASPQPPASEKPPGGCKPSTVGTASTPVEELWAASEGRNRGAGREQHLHAGSDGSPWSHSSGVTGHRGRWSGRAVSDMLGVGAAATWSLVTLSCLLYPVTLTLQASAGSQWLPYNSDIPGEI